MDQWSFRKTGTMGTLTRLAEIGVFFVYLPPSQLLKGFYHLYITFSLVPCAEP